jgi:hypothetical protein
VLTWSTAPLKLTPAPQPIELVRRSQELAMTSASEERGRLMLALGIRHLTGYALATDVADRERAEWPPHPTRVFMALAAACFETGEDAEDRSALEWLERQNAPEIRTPEALPREVIRHYVPANDPNLPEQVRPTATPGTIKAGLASFPITARDSPGPSRGYAPTSTWCICCGPPRARLLTAAAR